MKIFKATFEAMDKNFKKNKIILEKISTKNRKWKCCKKIQSERKYMLDTVCISCCLHTILNTHKFKRVELYLGSYFIEVLPRDGWL